MTHDGSAGREQALVEIKADFPTERTGAGYMLPPHGPDILGQGRRDGPGEFGRLGEDVAGHIIGLDGSVRRRSLPGRVVLVRGRVLGTTAVRSEARTVKDGISRRSSGMKPWVGASMERRQGLDRSRHRRHEDGHPPGEPQHFTHDQVEVHASLRRHADLAVPDHLQQQRHMLGRERAERTHGSGSQDQKRLFGARVARQPVGHQVIDVTRCGVSLYQEIWALQAEAEVVAMKSHLGGQLHARQACRHHFDGRLAKQGPVERVRFVLGRQPAQRQAIHQEFCCQQVEVDVQHAVLRVSPVLRVGLGTRRTRRRRRRRRMEPKVMGRINVPGTWGRIA